MLAQHGAFQQAVNAHEAPVDGELTAAYLTDGATSRDGVSAGGFAIPQQKSAPSGDLSVFSSQPARKNTWPRAYRKRASRAKSLDDSMSMSTSSSANWAMIETKGAMAGTARADDEAYTLFVKGTKYVLEPRSRAALRWMMFILVVTVYTSLTTPVELAWFSNGSKWAETNFFLVSNIFVIIVFAIDIVVNFNLAYVDDEGGYLVSTRRDIAKQYFRFWFWLDFLATFPFDACHKGGGGQAQVLRLFKLFRLFRITKIMTSTRVMRLLESEHSINYHKVSLWIFFLAMALTLHIMGCGLFFFGGVSILNNEDDAFTGESIGSQYLYGMYWAAMTLSTIGYGDVPLHTDALRLYAIFCMLLGASAYAYMVGALIQIILSMNRREEERRTLLTEVNGMVKSAGVEQKQKRRIRMFFSKTESGEGRLRDYLPYFHRLSPQLAAHVIRCMMKNWLPDMWLLERVYKDNHFIVNLTHLLREQSFAPKEVIFFRNDTANTMYICTTGRFLLVGRGRLFCGGKGVGEEIMMPKRQTYGYSVYATTYVDAWRIERDTFRDFLRAYPVIQPRIRWTFVAHEYHRHGAVSFFLRMANKSGAREGISIKPQKRLSVKGKNLNLLALGNNNNNSNGRHESRSSSNHNNNNYNNAYEESKSNNNAYEESKNDSSAHEEGSSSGGGGARNNVPLAMNNINSHETAETAETAGGSAASDETPVSSPPPQGEE